MFNGRNWMMHNVKVILILLLKTLYHQNHKIITITIYEVATFN